MAVAAGVAVVAMLGACSDGSEVASDGGDSSAPTVIATTSIWADVTSQVGCGEVQVDTLIPVGADAHEFEPTVQEADALRGASLVVANGLGLEEGLADTLDAAQQDGVTVVEVGPELDPIAGGDHDHAEEEGGHSDDEPHADDEAHAEDAAAHADEDAHSEDEAGHPEDDAATSEEEADHDHGDGDDPHVWMDPERVAMAVPVIAEALEQVDGLPVDAEQIQGCADDYVAELTALSEEMAATLGPLEGAQRHLVTNHEALGYLADRFDLEVIGTVIPSTSTLGESNVRDLDELAQLMQDEGVTRIFGEVTGSDQVAAALAEKVGADVEVVSLYTESVGEEGSGAETYLDMMRANAALIAGQG
jgi:ABC-type Zn uptake system ZnuABC Zn-binding protein ZnuA